MVYTTKPPRIQPDFVVPAFFGPPIAAASGGLPSRGRRGHPAPCVKGEAFAPATAHPQIFGVPDTRASGGLGGTGGLSVGFAPAMAHPQFFQAPTHARVWGFRIFVYLSE
jgi:hypothetical protein